MCFDLSRVLVSEDKIRMCIAKKKKKKKKKKIVKWKSEAVNIQRNFAKSVVMHPHTHTHTHTCTQVLQRELRKSLRLFHVANMCVHEALLVYTTYNILYIVGETRFYYYAV